MHLPLNKRLRTLALSALITSPAAVLAVLRWRHWLAVKSGAFAWLDFLIAVLTTAFWLVVFFIHWETRLRKYRLLVANKRKDE